MGMTNEEKILEMLTEMKSDMGQMKKDVSTINERLDGLEESNEEVRSGVNALLEWAEECGNVIKFPLPKVK